MRREKNTPADLVALLREHSTMRGGHLFIPFPIRALCARLEISEDRARKLVEMLRDEGKIIGKDPWDENVIALPPQRKRQTAPVWALPKSERGGFFR